MNGSDSRHWVSCPRTRPKARPPTASTATSAPSQSKWGEASSSRDSGMYRNDRNRASEHERRVDQEHRPPAGGVEDDPADRWSQRAEGRGDRCPQAERPGPGGALEGVRDQRQRSRDEKRARDPLQQAGDDEHLEVDREAAEHGRDPEADEADDEDPPTTVVVADRSGEDQEGGQRREVAGRDVGLGLELAHEGALELLAELGQGQGDHGAIEEDDGRPEHGRSQGPALRRRHRASLPIDRGRVG